MRVSRRIDIRKVGSGNVGATNAGRILGSRGFVATLAGDVGKGAAAVVVARLLGLDAAVWAVLPSVVAGHIWPVTLGFRGGKGVGPGIGALLVAAPLPLAIVVAVFGVLFLVSRRYQLSGLTSILFLPVIALLLGTETVPMLGMLATVVIVLVAHRQDIRELLQQTQ